MDKSKYLLQPIGHYSMTNNPSIFDEESLTALELVGRLTAKMVEFCKQYNEMVGDLLDTEGKHDQQIVEMWEKINSDMVVVAREAVAELIESGVFGEELASGFNDLTTKDKAKCWAFNDLEEMRNMPFISDGDTVMTKGYYTNGDGGGAVYHIRKATDNDTDDGGAVILFGDLAAILVPNDRVYIKQFGAVGDGVEDDTAAIMRAASYASAHDIILASDKDNYLTSDTCVISRVNRIDFPGTYTYLDIRHNPANGSHKVIYVNEVATLILRDFKRSQFTLGYIDKLDIIADTAINASSAFAYNYIGGGSVGVLTISGTGNGWVNENVFDQVRFVSISIDGDYGHNNNRFYDITMEGSGNFLRLGNCNSNYFTIRGEAMPTIETTPNSINNIVKNTWCSTDSSFMYNYIHDYKNGVLKTHDMFTELNGYELARFDMWNMPFTNGINSKTGEVTFGTWQTYGGIRIPIETHMIFKAKGKKIRVYVTFFDENGENVQHGGCLLSTSALRWLEADGYYGMQGNLDELYFAIRPWAESTAKSCYIAIANGNSVVTTLGATLQCWAAYKPMHTRGAQKPKAKSRPTQTENVPLGFEVMNSVAGSNVYGWRFNGTEWVDIPYNYTPTT